MKFLWVFTAMLFCFLFISLLYNHNSWNGTAQFRREVIVHTDVNWLNSLQPLPLYCEEANKYANVYFTDAAGNLLRYQPRSNVVWINYPLVSTDTHIYMYYDKQ